MTRTRGNRSNTPPNTIRSAWVAVSAVQLQVGPFVACGMAASLTAGWVSGNHLVLVIRPGDLGWCCGPG
jgi:hypothetical protein